jgi:hypothetical protein
MLQVRYRVSIINSRTERTLAAGRSRTHGDHAMSTPRPGQTREQRARRRLLLAKWQADLAYFQARLGLIGDPATLNQHAQRRAFRLLHQSIGEKLVGAPDAQRPGAG